LGARKRPPFLAARRGGGRGFPFIWLNFSCLLFLTLCWPPSFFFVAIGLRGFGPVTVVALRILFGAAALLAANRAMGLRLPRDFQTWRRFFFLGAIGLVLPFLMYAIGEQWVESGLAAIVNATTPIFTLLFAHAPLHDDRLTPGKILGVAAGFSGILLLFAPEVSGGWAGNRTLMGLGLFLFAPVSYALTSVYVRRWMRDTPGTTVALGQSLAAAVVAAPLALLFESPLATRPAWAPVAAVAAMGVFGTGVALAVYYWLMRRTSASYTSLVTYLIPPGSLGLGMFFLGERPGWNALAGGSLILSGVLLAQSRWGRAAPPEEPRLVPVEELGQ